jgi:phosphoribosylamine--glycine ligase
VIEFNARFGDPETEVVLPRLKSDIYDIFSAVADGRDPGEAEWHDFATLGIVLASKGYPGSYEKGYEITGTEQVDGVVYHMGTAIKEGRLVTSGGRVMIVVCRSADPEQARCRALEEVRKIGCENLFYRSDIGMKALSFLVKK